MNKGEMISLFRNYVNERPYAEDVDQTAVFWKDEDISEYLNQGVLHYNSVINDLDESYNIAVRDYQWTGNPITDPLIIDQYTIQLPDDTQKIKHVEVLQKSGDPIGIDCRPMTINEKNRFFVALVNSFRYYFQGNRVKFLPALPTQPAMVVRLYYLQRVPQLKNDTDECQLPPECHENIVLYAVVKGLLRDKQSNLAASWSRQLAAKDTWLANIIKPRQAQEANTVLPRNDWDYSYQYLSGF